MQTLPVRHLGISIGRSPDVAYAFLSRPENFPRWASGLGTLQQVSDGWVSDTPHGRMKLRFSAPNAFGVLDHDVIPPAGGTIHVPLRLLPNGEGCELVLSLFRQPGMDEAQFEADAQWVLRDLQAAKACVEALPG